MFTDGALDPNAINNNNNYYFIIIIIIIIIILILRTFFVLFHFIEVKLRKGWQHFARRELEGAHTWQELWKWCVHR